MRSAIAISIALLGGTLCAACEVIDDFTPFHVVSSGDGSAGPDGSPHAGDLAEAIDLAAIIDGAIGDDMSAIVDAASMDLATVDVAMTDSTVPPDLKLPPPILTKVSPAIGPTTGGTFLVLSGMNFVQGAKVTIAGLDAAGVWVSSAQMNAMSPAKPGALGLVPVAVTNPDAQTASRADLFAYYSGTVAFAAAVKYGGLAPSAGPRWVALGDLNSDGKTDVAINLSQSNSAGIGVFLNVGNGNLGVLAIYSAGPQQPWSGALGDVNGDGKPDIAVANAAGGTSTVHMLINNGNGTFGAPAPYMADNNPHAVALGDLNGDGKPDLVVANAYGNDVSVLLNNGNGTFAAAVQYGVGTLPVSIAVADLNGDGKGDVVTANANGNNVSVLLNNGNGTFAATANYAAGSAQNGVAVADVNGDGSPDVLVANAGDNTVGVLVNNGNGTFAAQVTYATGATPYSVAAGDLNGDGKLDLAVANGGATTVSILLNKGDGTFAPATSVVAGTHPQAVAIGDVDGDGKLDVAVVNDVDNNLAILLNASL